MEARSADTEGWGFRRWCRSLLPSWAVGCVELTRPMTDLAQGNWPSSSCDDGLVTTDESGMTAPSADLAKLHKRTSCTGVKHTANSGNKNILLTLE